MKYSLDDILKSKTKFCSITEFIEKLKIQNLICTPQAIRYCLDHGILDEFRPSHERFVVLNKKAKNYEPKD